jgi:hypothetical protein
MNSKRPDFQKRQPQFLFYTILKIMVIFYSFLFLSCGKKIDINQNDEYVVLQRKGRRAVEIENKESVRVKEEDALTLYPKVPIGIKVSEFVVLTAEGIFSLITFRAEWKITDPVMFHTSGKSINSLHAEIEKAVKQSFMKIAKGYRISELRKITAGKLEPEEGSQSEKPDRFQEKVISGAEQSIGDMRRAGVQITRFEIQEIITTSP